jgi:hypothetical protein
MTVLKNTLLGTPRALPFPETSSQENSLQAKIPFTRGEILHGRILKVLAEGEVLMSARGRTFQAYTESPLAIGGSHQFQVEAVGETIVLRRLGGERMERLSPLRLWASSRMDREELSKILAELAALRDSKSFPQGIRSLLQKLGSLFPTLVYEGPTKSGEKWIYQCLLASGLFWEHKILRHLLGARGNQGKIPFMRDLKGALLSLLKECDAGSEDFTQVGPLMQKIEKALTLLEQDQFLNLLTLREGWGWSWLIPGDGSGGLRKAEVFGKRSSGGNGYHLFMCLDLSVLGKLDTEVFLMGPSVDIRFILEDEEKASMASENVKWIETGLKAAGLSLSRAAFEVREGSGGIPPLFDAAGTTSIHVVI